MRETTDSPKQMFISHVNRAHPSFLEGMARLLDVCDTLNQNDLTEITKLHEQIRSRRLAMPTGPEADAEALRKVWLTVGEQLKDAIGEFETVEQDNLRSVGNTK